MNMIFLDHDLAVLNSDALPAALRLLHNFNKWIKVILKPSQVAGNIENKGDFEAILERKVSNQDTFLKKYGENA